MKFTAASSQDLDAGEYSIPYQAVSMILMGPGTTISHDALRILARHGTLLAAVGDGGVKFYTAPPIGQGRSEVARAHARLWADESLRKQTVRRMFSLRFGEIPPQCSLSALRGIEGARLKKAYRIVAAQHGIEWKGRRYDRNNPNAADLINQAINHSATFVEAAAETAIAAVGALPPLGFIHEDSSNAFTLDIADLYRVSVTLPLAFVSCRRAKAGATNTLEREIRLEAARVFRNSKLIPRMIDSIKEILGVDDNGRDQ